MDHAMRTKNQTTNTLPLKNYTENPTVSVVICAYNAASFIVETLDSLFAQTFSDYEVIIVNDGSTDETATVLQPYLSRIIYHEQPNQGPAAARNAALRLARGQYISVLDSDDLWMPDYLEKMVGYLQAHPEIDLHYPNAVLFGNSHLDGQIYQDMYPSSHPVTLEKLLTRECNVFGLVTFRRAMLEQVGQYDEDLCGVEDLDLWLRMAQHGCRFSFTEEVLVKYRRRPSSLSASSPNYYQQVIRALRKFQNADLTTPLQRELAEQYCRKIEADRDLLLAKYQILQGNHLVAIQHLSNVLIVRPKIKLKLALIGLVFFPKLLARFVRRSAANMNLPNNALAISTYSAGV
jgi:glycosyltransferase involved in cell wall biosynthesis